MVYEDIMKMPLKDVNDLLLIKSLEEKKKAEMLKEQQDKSMKTLNNRGNSDNRKEPPFFRMFSGNNGAPEI